MNVLILEEASLEILPAKFASSKEAIRVTERFGVTPRMQILDRNFHRDILSSFGDHQKKGRPDVVHFAVLDATSTPLFEDGLLDLFVRTRQGVTIQIKTGTRPPRTLQRFCGVMATLLSGTYNVEEEALFSVEKDRSFSNLVKGLKIDKIISFSSQGSDCSLRSVVAQESASEKRIAWVVGGFPHGHFSNEVLELSDKVVSISPKALPAHVVTARLCYELEQSLNL